MSEMVPVVSFVRVRALLSLSLYVFVYFFFSAHAWAFISLLGIRFQLSVWCWWSFFFSFLLWFIHLPFCETFSLLHTFIVFNHTLMRFSLGSFFSNFAVLNSLEMSEMYMRFFVWKLQYVFALKDTLTSKRTWKRLFICTSCGYIWMISTQMMKVIQKEEKRKTVFLFIFIFSFLFLDDLISLSLLRLFTLCVSKMF